MHIDRLSESFYMTRVGLGCLRTSVLTTQDGGITHLGADLPLTDSLVGRASVMIADDAGTIPAQFTISMTSLQLVYSKFC